MLRLQVFLCLLLSAVEGFHRRSVQQLAVLRIRLTTLATAVRADVAGMVVTAREHCSISYLPLKAAITSLYTSEIQVFSDESIWE